MNPDTTVLLVGANDEMVHKARRLGLHVLLLQHPTKITEAQRALADAVHILDYTDWSLLAPLVSTLYREPGFAVAMSLTEAGLEAAGRVNDLLGLGGTGHAVARRFRDKWAMRRHLAAHDPSAVGAAPLTGRDDLDSFGRRHGYPFIVKPLDATASFGVFRVDGPADTARVWAAVERLRGTRTDRGSMPFPIEDFLMEEYLDGPEFSVESFSFHGRHVIVALTEKFVDPDTFTELGHAVPARLDEAVAAEIRAATSRFLDLIGIADGVCHTEIRLGSRGPAVIESHNRIGGDAIPDLVRGAYGIDLTSYALGWPFGLVPELPDHPPAHAGAGTRFLVGVPGRVESVGGLDAARARDGVLAVSLTARPGDPVRAPRDNWDRLGLIAVTGRDTTDALHRAAEIARDCLAVRITADDGTSHLAEVAEIAVTAEPAGAEGAGHATGATA
ncbi:ATP-grasp domain-containing protein [Streptomyces sp. RS10V-4]|uniref:ATP-grasp domain-containing protein n=1 Tax=Streptomyces rhizoryzae TaxID=2932493 RepID=UPI0020030120|nr:ATP-grasp domain-containing protein [Streptomyces rhizoryzae]MCK7627378.1 ATP-grasp domain-containing protein [Streptomyces rhizoryzae]